MPREPKHIVLRCIILAAVLAAAAAAAAGAAHRPAIAGRDVFTGKQLALEQFRGKPVFVNIWGSWCGGCNVEARTLARFERAHRRQVVFLGVDTIDSKAGARAFYKRYDTDYPSIWDPRGMISGSWGRGVPTTLVFDRRHVLVRTLEGATTKAALEAALRRATRR
jgi:thiol-disulfide isomerase/thioredoxin